MPKESNLEIKVGLFVLAALIAMAWFLFSINDSTVFEGGQSMKVVFNFANGLKKNSPVRIAGVDEGLVRDVKLFFDREASRTRAEVQIWIRKETKIPVDSFFTINQLGLLGEKYIEIVPGLDKKEFYKEGDVIVGKDPISQEALSQRVMDVANRLETAITKVNTGLLQDQNLDSLSLAFKSFGSMASNLSAVIEKVNQGEGTMGRLFSDEKLYDDLQAILHDVRTGKGTLGKFVTDDGVYQNLEGFTAEIKENPWKLLYKTRTRR